LSVVFCLASAWCGAARADIGPLYTYIDLGYLDADVDGRAGDGWFAGGSYGMRRLHFLVRYDDLGLDGLDRTRWQLGVGWHGWLGASADLVAQGSYVELDDEVDGERVDVDGVLLSGGFRWALVPRLEINAFVNHLDIKYGDADTSWEANGMYCLGPSRRLALGLGYAADEAVTWRAWLRVNLRR